MVFVVVVVVFFFFFVVFFFFVFFDANQNDFLAANTLRICAACSASHRYENA